MYSLKTNSSFDSAHFLAGYEGKCRNLHGHRWTVEVEVGGEKLIQDGQTRGNRGHPYSSCSSRHSM